MLTNTVSWSYFMRRKDCTAKVGLLCLLNTNYTNTIYKAQLTDCPGVLTNVKMRCEIDEFLKDLKNLLLQVVSLILSHKAAVPACLKQCSPNLVQVQCLMY